jgi:hypothetical protein
VFTDRVSDGKNSINKNHRKISTEKIHWFFHLYSSIFWWWLKSKIEKKI